MGNGSNPFIKPDLFSTAQKSPDASSPPASEPKQPLRKDEPAAAASPSYALPTNLPSALKHLDNDQLDRLLAAVLSEQQRRGKSVEPSRKQQTKEVAPPLAQGKLNAVRAAFKAGVRPSRIARQFGISLARCEKGSGERSKEVRTWEGCRVHPGWRTWISSLRRRRSQTHQRAKRLESIEAGERRRHNASLPSA